MTLPVYPNTISINNLQTEYGVSSGSQSPLTQFYRNDSGPVYEGSYGYPGGGSAKAPPASGTISIGDFHGATKYTPINRTVTLTVGSGTWTVPSTLIGNLTVTLIGGGGGGCHWPSGAAGGAGGGGARFIGPISRGAQISYVVGAGGPSVYHDSTRYARDAKDSRFGVAGEYWYLYVPGLGTGGYNMTGSQRGPGTGSTGIVGNSSVSSYGRGGDGKPERTSGRAGDAWNFGGGGGACDRTDSSGGYGAGGGANGSNRKGTGGSTGYGPWPGGGAAGNNSQSPTPTTFSGGDGAIFISGVW